MRRDTNFENARDELFAHVNRCGVLRATADQQREWMDDAMGYMAERFPGLTPEQLEQLRQIGLRFCAPVIAHGRDNTALTAGDQTEESEETEDAADADSGAMAGAA